MTLPIKLDGVDDRDHLHPNGHVRLELAPRGAEPRPSPVRISVIIPATDQPATLDRCVNAIVLSDDPPEQVIIAEDPAMGGAAGARNAGAHRARGDVLVFVDSDVIVHRDVFTRIRAAFEEDPDLTALFGSYDADRGARGVVSAFRNLLHHHVHHAARGQVVTFWAGLGAIRRAAFEESGGFDLANPIEDIELGMRLSVSGAKLRLDPAVQGTHLKSWTLGEMVLTDFIVRGAPWVKLMLHYNLPRSALNVGWRHRLSAAACLVTLGGLAARRPAVAGSAGLSFVALNRSFYALLLARVGPLEASAGVGLHALHHLVAIAAVPAGYVLYLAERTAPPLPLAEAAPTGIPQALESVLAASFE